MTLDISPIGKIRTLGNGKSLIMLDESLEEGLLGVEAGSRLDVLYWMHELTPQRRAILQCHPRGDTSRPMQGVFSLRSPMRPNPIGVTSVEVLELSGTGITVEGLDAHDGSPVIDIKHART